MRVAALLLFLTSSVIVSASLYSTPDWLLFAVGVALTAVAWEMNARGDR
ncbi:MAG TPA: hypothetical protein VEA81_00185 [Burkholderiaceae bacterium]|nr:hypothetical protein [Burkholderiaceae bacterium]